MPMNMRSQSVQSSSVNTAGYADSWGTWARLVRFSINWTPLSCWTQRPEHTSDRHSRAPKHVERSPQRGPPCCDEPPPNPTYRRTVSLEPETAQVSLRHAFPCGFYIEGTTSR